MLPNTQLFNQILEQYSFSVAHHCINSVSPDTQSELIAFINHIDNNPDTTELIGISATSEPIQEIASPWQEVLNEPVNWHSVHTQWLVGVTRQRTQRHQRYITHLEETIRTTEHRINELKASLASEDSQSNLLRWYEQNRDNYRQYLLAAQQVHQTSLQQLSSLENH